MKKNYKYNGILVKFNGTAKELKFFITTNDHLVNCEIEDAEVMELEKVNNLNKIRAKRAREYPPIADQLDEIMKWLATEKEITIPAKLKSVAMKCMSVKSKNPF